MTFLQTLARKLGVELIPQWQMPDLALARHLDKLFRQYSIHCVLDVGPNKGSYGTFLRKEVGYQGSIVSFEPNNENRKALENRARDDSLWHVLDYGLSDSQESVDSEELTNRINTKRLDTVFSQLPFVTAKNTYLKMDTQGTDTHVLAGSENTLKQIIALQAECSLQQSGDTLPDYMSSVLSFTQLGYKVSGLFPVNVDRSLCVQAFDCVMVRPENISL